MPYEAFLHRKVDSLMFSPQQVFGEWAQVEVVELVNDGTGLAFGIVGGRSSGVVIKSVLPQGVADRVGDLLSFVIDYTRNF